MSPNSDLARPLLGTSMYLAPLTAFGGRPAAVQIGYPADLVDHSGISPNTCIVALRYSDSVVPFC
jgi:hypothetical protein